MKKVWEFTLRGKNLDQIISGEKTVELRSGKVFEQIKPGDDIIFFNHQSRIQKEVKDIVVYKDIKTVLETEGIQNCLPGVKNIHVAMKIYLDIPGYKQKIDEFGIIAIKF